MIDDLEKWCDKCDASVPYLWSGFICGHTDEDNKKARELKDNRASGD